MCRDLGLGRGREVVADAIQEGLYASVLDSRTEENRGELQTDCSTTDCLSDLGYGWFLVHNQHFTNLVIDLGKLFQEFLSFLFCQSKNRFWNFVRLDHFDTNVRCEN